MDLTLYNRRRIMYLLFFFVNLFPMKWTILFCIQLVAITSFGQKCDQVLLKGRVKDTIRPQGFYNMMVVNRTTGKGVFGQPNGAFNVYASPNDSITISVKNYALIHMTVNPDSNCQCLHTFYIEGNVQEVAEVIVKPLKTLEQIREERESLALRETRQVTGIEVLQSPITALYQAFSKKEQSKRKVAEMEYADDQREVVKELLRIYVAYDVVALTDDEFDEFVFFLNVNPDFLRTASEYELIEFIKGKYEHFMLTRRKD